MAAVGAEAAAGPAEPGHLASVAEGKPSSREAE